MNDKYLEILNFSKEKNITLDQAISIFQLESIDKRIEANKSNTIIPDDINATTADFTNNIYKSFEGYIVESIEQIKNYYAMIIISTDLNKQQIANILEKINKHLPMHNVSKISHLDKVQTSNYSTMFMISKLPKFPDKTIIQESYDMNEILCKSGNVQYSTLCLTKDKIGNTELNLIDKELEAQRELQRNAPLFTKEEMVYIIESINTKGYLICDIEESNIKISSRKLVRFAKLKDSEMEKAVKEYNLTSTIDERKRISLFDIRYKKETYYILTDTEKNDWKACENILKETLLKIQN